MAFLKIMSGNMKGQKFEIDRDKIIIGRSPDNVVSLDDLSVSSKHCSVLREGRKFTIRDLGSTNGTRLNNVKVTKYRLSPKDIIMAGSVAIMFDGDDVEPNERPPIPATIAGLPTRSFASAGASSPIGVSSVFGAQRNSKGMWIVVIAIVGILALAALGWFLFNLFKA